MMQHHRRRVGVSAAAAAVAALVLAGCVGQQGSGDAGDTPDGLTADQYQVALDYVGGEAKPADDTLEPVKIGFINVEGGAFSFPEVSAAAQVAADVVNDYLGGVQGHPVEVEVCGVVEGDEDALSCAQKFVNDPAIVSIQLGFTIIGTGSIYQTVGDRKPIIGFGPFGPQDLDTENAIYYTSGSYSSAPAIVKYATEELGAETLAVVYDGGNPGTAGNVQVLSGLAPELGLEVTAVPVANPSEWVSALVSAGAQTADAVAVVSDPSSCVSAAQAVQELAFSTPVISYNICLFEAVADALGDFPQWTYIGPGTPIQADDSDEAKLLIAATDLYSPGSSLGGAVPNTFGVLLSQVRAMNTIGVDALTTESLAAELRAFTGPAFLGVPDLECGQFTSVGVPSVCSNVAYVTAYEGNDSWTKLSGDGGLDIGTLGLGH